MNAMQPNRQTGYLESINPTTLESFTSDKKVRFLDLAHEYADRRELPDVANLCKTVGVKYRTLMDHLDKDELFKNAYDEVKAKVYSGMSHELSLKAKSKMGTIANLAVLKYLESGKFRDDERSLFIADSASLKALHSQAIEAEIVDKKDNTVG